jgi:type IX secretion system PorP/SprF family membrane protein
MKNQTQNIRFKFEASSLIICFILLFGSNRSIQAQQVPRYSQFIMNEFLINPAVAGVDGMTLTNLTGRMEWVGFSGGTPKTYSFNVQTRLLKRRNDVLSRKTGNKFIKSRKGRVGIGGGFINDYNGAFQRIGFSGTYAYHVTFNNSQLSFGLTGSIIQLNIRPKYVEFKEEDDRMKGLTDGSIWIPDFAAGINYMTPHFHIGFSSVQLTESHLSFGNTEIQLNSTEINYNRNYFLLLSYINYLNTNKDWEFETSSIVKSNDKIKAGIKAQADILLRFIYEKSYWFGAGYRTSNDLIILTGLRYNQLYATYSFDYGTNAMSKNSYGSHEISLTLKFGESTRRFNWLERY